MRLLETWVATPLAQAVGLTLLHSLWEGAIIAAALAAGLAAMRSPRVRYAAACVAMLLMLGGFALTLVRVMPEGVHGLRAAGTPTFTVWNVATDRSGGAPWHPGLAGLVPWLAAFWVVGVWIFALRQVGGWISVCRLRWRGVCCAPERWQKELARLSARLRVARPVVLLESFLAEVPMVVGHLRPVILMPIGLLGGLPAGQIEAILLHELAHIRRYDYLVNVLQRAVECLLFYHPAAWWVSRVIRAERENCCDDVAVIASGDAQEYVAALAALEQTRWSGRQAAVAGAGGSLVKRVRRLLYPQRTNRAWTPVFAALILVITAVVAFAAWPSEPARQSPSPEKRRAGRAEASPYDRWLNEEVVYIISDEERAAFQKLTSDEERDKFVEQFWERRNPHPGSPENKFKEEYYRRIAYANEHFASDKPGWKTDRGYMYIAYGPPDKITVTAYGPAPGPHVPYGIQVWTYRHVDGVGDNLSVQFMDTTGKGDYELPFGRSSFRPTHKPLEVQPRRGENEPTPRPQGRAEAFPYDPWLNWVNEEVVYIITDEERIAFQKLTSDEGREMFVEQFWDRRNPNPGSPQNEFKEEYYRRIAYANQHYASGRPGWKTDRGHIYILYGPPDEVDSHPEGTPAPWEEWKYQYIKGLGTNVIFTFIDTKRTGDYLLAPGPPVKRNPTPS